MQRDTEGMQLFLCGQLHSLAPRGSDVSEEAGIAGRGTRADELDVILQISPEGRGTPGPCQPLAACARFDSPGNDLLERWIREEVVGQLAGRIRIRTGQLDRRRRPHADIVRSVCREIFGRVEIEADRRIEALETCDRRSAAGSGRCGRECGCPHG